MDTKKWQHAKRPINWPAPASLAALAAFALYVATASRDIVGGAGIDSAKFGYMGRILGVPHPPGYPLYMLIGWLFSWLPIGSLIFRMSVLSALFGGATVWLLATLMELLGCEPLVAALVAFLAGAGRVYWSQAVIAEVYTLHTTLVLGTLVALIRWRRSGNTSWLYAASICFGLDLAHHTDVAVFAPAILVFIVATDPRVLGSVRTVSSALALAIAPLSLYAYIVIRTRQGADYVEAGATTLAGLAQIVSGRQFGYLLFRGGFVDAVRDRSADLGRFFVQELAPWGCLLAAIGAVAMWRRDRGGCLLIVLGALGVMAFVFNYYPPDIEVFLLPAFLLCWVATAATIEAVWRMNRRFELPVTILLVAWIGWQLGSNVSANNLSPESFESRLFRGLFDQMPAQSAIVGDTIDLSHMVLYKLFAEPAVAAKKPTLVVPGEFGATRVFGFVRSTPAHPVVEGDPSQVDRLVAERPAVYAFGRLADPLRAQGFQLEPLRLPDRPLPDFLARLDRGMLVAAAVPGKLPPRVLTPAGPAFRSIGASHVRGPAQCYAVIGVAGDRRGAREFSGSIGHVEIHKGQPIGSGGQAATADVDVECGPSRASITVNGHAVSTAESAVPVVTMDASGELVDQTLAAPQMNYHVTMEWRWQPIYRVAAPRRCVAVGAEPTDISTAALEAGIAVYLQPGTRMRLILGSDVPLRPRYGRFDRSHAPFKVSDAAQAEIPGGSGTAAHWTRVDVGPSSATGLEIVDLALGAPARLGTASTAPTASTASVASMSPAASPVRTEVCAITLGNFPVLAGAVDGSERVIADESRDELFGDGWHPVEEDAAGGFRWTAAPAAHVLVPLGRVSAMRVGVRARVWEDADAQDVIGLWVNGRHLEPVTVARGWGTYEWSVPAAAWRVGVNDVVVESPRLRRPASGSADTRLLGVAVREIDFSVELQR